MQVKRLNFKIFITLTDRQIWRNLSWKEALPPQKRFVQAQFETLVEDACACQCIATGHKKENIE